MSNKLSDIRNSDEYSAEREVELQTLQEAYRIANSDRISYSEEMKNMLKKLDTDVQKMEDERSELLLMLRVADNKMNVMKDHRNCEDLANLAENKDWIERQIEDERILHSELDSKIRDFERKTMNKQMELGGGDSIDRSVKLIKGKQSLERRLQTICSMYCGYLESNRKLREDIDNFRNERSNFDKIYMRLDVELAKLKTKHDKIVHTTTSFYDHREEIAAKLVQMREKAEKDTSQHNTEMKELVRVIDHDRKLRDFMSTKAMDRPEDPQLIAYKNKLHRDNIERQKADEDSLETMDMCFNRMKELMNQQCLDRLVDEFIEKEDRNYALFNYINVKHLEREKLQKEVQQLKEDISQHNSSTSEEAEERERKLLKMDGYRAKISSIADAGQAELNSALKILDNLTAKVTILFKAIECDDATLRDTLGFSEGVNVSNIQTYMGLIELRTNELLAIYNYVVSHLKETTMEVRMVLIGSGLVKPGHTQVKMPTPSLNDDVELESSRNTIPLHPLTRQEILLNINETLLKAQANQANQGSRKLLITDEILGTADQ